ncbi:hypothetical protein HaLaN_10058 [Haematococcus lacustris]|uniref:Uncharacterized protein n=1 Tax=Haematococcus lacustris TaxID=44745 RepID=A0A699Z470_HAELA|nr:hypothetical protein HaLaN_10058 [Haematococcus lacustris]
MHATGHSETLLGPGRHLTLIAENVESDAVRVGQLRVGGVIPACQYDESSAGGARAAAREAERSHAREAGCTARAETGLEGPHARRNGASGAGPRTGKRRHISRRNSSAAGAIASKASFIDAGAQRAAQQLVWRTAKIGCTARSLFPVMYASSDLPVDCDAMSAAHGTQRQALSTDREPTPVGRTAVPVPYTPRQ